jgi:hypothetical protein
MSDERTGAIAALRRHLETRGVDGLLPPLVEAWDEFLGGDAQAMAGHKLQRLEEPRWEPPHLSFLVERHGATVMGSSRAELQRWVVNLETRTASIDESYRRHRQLTKMNPRMDVRPLAQEVAACIAARAYDPRLRWRDADVVHPVLARVIPEQAGVPKQTLQGRRRRFLAALHEELSALGWEPTLENPSHFRYRDSARS